MPLFKPVTERHWRTSPQCTGRATVREFASDDLPYSRSFAPAIPAGLRSSSGASSRPLAADSDGQLPLRRTWNKDFPRRVELADCRQGELSLHGVRVCAGRLTEQLRKLVRPVKTHAGNERFAKFLERHVGEIFTFLRRPQPQADGTVAFLDATNWRAEQAIRPAVVNRKLWGGNRTWPGAEAQAILTSVLATATQHALDLLPLLSRARTEAEPVLVLAGR